MNQNGTIESGWEASEMRSYLKNIIKPLIPETVRNAIVNVTKVSSTYENGSMVNNGQVTIDDVWIPSHREMYSVVYSASPIETDGAAYTKFNSMEDIVRRIDGEEATWWLRSANNNNCFFMVNYDGSRVFNIRPKSKRNIALGFCTN